jgi:hypothetical protein
VADTLDDLLRDAERLAAVADTLSLRFARELSTVLRDLERRLGPLVREALDTRQATRLIEATRALVLRQEIRRLLEMAGYDDLAATVTQRGLAGLARDVLATREGGQTLEFMAGISGRVGALQALIGRDLLDEGDQIARALWKAVLRAAVADADHEQTVKGLAALLDKSDTTVRTLYDTSLSVYTRQVEALASGDDAEGVFMYAGPADGRLRPFCYEHVGKVYAKADIDSMDNGQLDNVFLTGGGYQCRHVWMAVSRFGEARELVGTDERVPSVARALSRVTVKAKAA